MHWKVALSSYQTASDSEIAFYGHKFASTKNPMNAVRRFPPMGAAHFPLATVVKRKFEKILCAYKICVHCTFTSLHTVSLLCGVHCAGIVQKTSMKRLMLCSSTSSEYGKCILSHNMKQAITNFFRKDPSNTQNFTMMHSQVIPTSYVPYWTA